MTLCVCMFCASVQDALDVWLHRRRVSGGGAPRLPAAGPSTTHVDDVAGVYITTLPQPVLLLLSPSERHVVRAYDLELSAWGFHVATSPAGALVHLSGFNCI